MNTPFQLRASFSKFTKFCSYKNVDSRFRFRTYISSSYDVDFIAIKILKIYKGFDHEKFGTYFLSPDGHEWDVQEHQVLSCLQKWTILMSLQETKMDC